jgi:RnfABCDGE-type electron transport complex B subunit
MTLVIILLAAATMLALALLMAWILGWANKTFHVEVDPRVEKVNEALPGANCGGCGYVGCNEYAEAVVAGDAPPDLCPVGGVSCATALADILGIELEQKWPYRPVVHCGAALEERLKRHPYEGEQTCAAANLVNGVQGCTYGCLGFGDCETACPFDAIHVIDGLATVDYEKCTGCGKCAEVCPRNIISMIPFKMERMLAIACSNKDAGKHVKAVCKVGCIGCRMCERKGGELFKVTDNLSRIDYDKYDPEMMEAAEVALEKCPMRRIIEVGKPSEEDLKALENEELPSIAEAEFKTTVDKTEWHG